MLRVLAVKPPSLPPNRPQPGMSLKALLRARDASCTLHGQPVAVKLLSVILHES